ncbi:hypothetical protein EV361DRAFT_1015373, partial [Lentinula raphanica]
LLGERGIVQWLRHYRLLILDSSFYSFYKCILEPFGLTTATLSINKTMILLVSLCNKVFTVESNLALYQFSSETPSTTIGTQWAVPLGTNSVTQTTFLIKQLVETSEWVTFSDASVPEFVTITGTENIATAVVSASGFIWDKNFNDGFVEECHFTSSKSGECIIEITYDPEHVSTASTINSGPAHTLQVIPITSTTSTGVIDEAPTDQVSTVKALIVAGIIAGGEGNKHKNLILKENLNQQWVLMKRSLQKMLSIACYLLEHPIITIMGPFKMHNLNSLIVHIWELRVARSLCMNMMTWEGILDIRIMQFFSTSSME